MKLVIVESPAKAKTIERFLGKDYKVAASYGHIRDLPGSAAEIPAEYKKEPWSKLAVNTAQGFAPIYVVTPESRKHVAALKKLLKDADEVLLATDEDREGESISWHLLEVLEPKVPVKRITFHEITRSAIERALAHPRSVDDQLVRAQESRRILDRLFGYTLSPVLWKKVRTKLSAGRVQSVAVRLIVEREEERMAFKSSRYWDVDARLTSDDHDFVATLQSIGEERIATGKDFDGETGQLREGVKALVLEEARARRIAQAAKENVPWRVARVERKETRQRPAPPFITSTLQQAASSALGMSPNRTMRVAQSLYEGVDLGGGEREGLITYMRTDSVNLSQEALSEAAGVIRKRFGDAYYDKPRYYKTKSKSAQEAHEAIRPTHLSRTPESLARYLEKEELALYTLIYNRMLACQMTDAILDKTTVDLSVDIDGVAHVFRANGSVVRFPGYLKALGGQQTDTLLPDMEEGQEIGTGRGIHKTTVAETIPQLHETKPPARYTEASLVRKLEEEGIGRPSTYAPTISTIQQRGYVLKKGTALVPAYVGMAVTHLLRDHFPQYVDIGFTARMEDDLDNIASGSRDWIDFLSAFYHGNGDSAEGLLQRIENELPNIEYPGIPIGADPETGKPIIVKIGQRSAYLQRGTGDGNGEEAERATIPRDILIDELTPEKAIEILKTREKTQTPLGQDPETGENVYVLLGPFGPYAQLGEAGEKGRKPRRTSLPRGMSLEEVTLDYALQLLRLPRKVGVDPESGKTITAGIGRFGPFVEMDGVYKSLKNFDEVFTIGVDEAAKQIAEKKLRGNKVELKDLGAHPETGAALKVMKGRYGPYVTDGKVNATLPKDAEPEAVTLDEAVKLIAEAAEKKGRSPAKKTARKTTAKKTTRKTARKSAKKTAKKTAAKPAKKSARKSAKKTSRGTPDTES